MLKKSLPSFLSKKSDQNQKNQNPLLQEQRKNNSSEDTDFSSNLISTSQQFYVVPKYALKLSLFIRRFIIILSISFGVILILNFVAYQIIKTQKGLQEDLISKVESYADVEVRAREIDAKTLSYKKFLNQRKTLLDKTKFILDNIGPDIQMKSVNVSHTNFTIYFSGKTALDFTKLITRYLEKDMLSEMIITSASLNTSEGRFNVSLTGNFK